MHEPAASVTAEAGVGAFSVAFQRWLAPGERRGLAELVHQSLDALRQLAV